MFHLYKQTFLFIGLSSIFVLISLGDLVYDLTVEGYQILEVLEFSLVLGVTASLGMLWHQLWKKYQIEQNSSILMKQTLQKFRTKHDTSLVSMKKAIEQQFNDWKFTPTEKRIARLLILGHSFQKISLETKTSSKTVQNHATSIYNKSLTLGRSDLAAFFLCEIFEE